MFAGGAFAEFAFCEHRYETLDTSAFQAFLAEIASKRCWILELDAFALVKPGGVSAAFSDSGFLEAGFADAIAQATGGVSTLRFSTHGYTSQAADTPAHTFHESRIDGLPVVDRQIASREGIGGLTSVYGEISLSNADGGLDTLLRDYALDGRRARILIGRETDALAAFGVVFTGTFQIATTTNEKQMTIRLSDGSAKLRALVNKTAYTGAGALEGGNDLKGKLKPVALGAVFNAAPPLVDSALLIYQVNDGAINDVPAAYDRGIVLTKGADYASVADLNATAPSAGQYRVYKAGGYFRLGSTPAGTVTADIQGDASGAGYVTTTADLVQRILANRANLNSSEIDATSFEALRTAAPAVVGLWTGTEPKTCAEAVDSLLYGIGAFGGFSRHGAFSVGVVADAVGVPEAASFDSTDILSVEREPLPAPVEPIAWRVGVGWQRNYTVQEDLAAAVTAARRTFCAEALRFSQTEDSAIQSRYLLARELGPIEAHYTVEADALAERTRLFALWGAKRSMFKVRLKLRALIRDLGQVVRLKDYPRHGLKDGVSARVLGHRVQGSTVELRVLV
jgi:hypothetical protein